MLTLALLALSLVTQPTGGPSPPSPVERLASLMEGRWDNGGQVEAEGNPARPHLYVTHQAFANPAIPGDALLYAQLNTGGAQGEVYRQRIYAFSADGEAITMTAYELASPEVLAVAGNRPAALQALTPDDLVRFDPGCDFHWTATPDGFRGAIAHGTCLRTSRRSGREMVILAEFGINPDRFSHSESGQYADTGDWAFQPPDDIPNLYDRVGDRPD